MKNYDVILENLLMKYGLYKEFKINNDDIFNNIINKKTDKNKRYILCGDLPTVDMWFYFWKPHNLVHIKYIVKDYLNSNETELNKIKVKQLNEIDENEYDGIIICSHNTFNIKNKLKNTFKDKEITDIYMEIPQYIRDIGIIYNGNMIYNYIRMKELAIDINVKNELGRFTKYINNKRNIIEYKNNEECVSVIWGAGRHTNALLNNTNIISELNVKYIVDKNENIWGEFINGIEVISFDKLKKIEFNTFFISSYAFRDEIKNEIKKQYNYKSYIDIYETNEEYNIINKEIFLHEISCEKNVIGKRLMELIEVYLAIRDFYNAEKYIQKYIQEKYDGYERLMKFSYELSVVLDELKESIYALKENNIHFIIIDSLDKYAMDNYMPYLSKYAMKNINFENAISPSTWTLESHISMFKGKDLFDDNTFVRTPIKEGKSWFIKQLKKRGFKTYVNNGVRILKYIFDEKIGEENSTKPISEMLWENMCFRVMNEDGKKFMYSRPMEYHDCILSASDNAAKYIDLQLKYYNDFINKNDYVVVLADHGNGDFREDLERRSHITFLIKTPDNKHKVINGLVTTRDIGRILIDVIDDKFNGENHNEYVKIQRTPIYNEISRRWFKRSNNEKFMQAFKIIRTLKEKFIVFEDGTEEFFLIEDEKNNLIDDPNYQSTINRLREIHLKDGFPDFSLDCEVYKKM